MIGRVVIPIMVAIGSITIASPALAQQVDQATQDAARTLGRAGLELFDKGELLGALSKFEQAYSLFRAPTLGLLSARCLAKLGRLKDADARYRDVVSIDLGPSPADAFVEAKKTAEQEGAALRERAPKITVVIEGVDASDVTVLIDGTPISPTALVSPQLVDPGAHKVIGKSDDQTVTVDVTVAEGQTERAVLKITPKPVVTAPPPAIKPEPGGFTPELRRTLSFIGMGVGGAGLVTGAILTGVLASKKSFLDGEGGCNDGHCPPTVQSDVDLYNGLRIGTTVSYVAGAVFAGAGVALLLTTPRPPSAPAKPGPTAGI